MRVDSLEQFITDNITMSKDDPYYGESFANLVGDYYSCKGEFSDADVIYLKKNGVEPSDIVGE